MFAHCLLPALLLLAALDYCTAVRIIKTVAVAGNPSSEHGRIEKFYIPSEQCYGILIVHKQKPLVCPEGSGIGGLTVTVFDTEPVDITISEVERTIDHVKIVRRTCSGRAFVYVEVACAED